MEERQQPIIVKKKKAGHDGHHGGAWKVAYADFVTALMAFFLVMWLVTMVAPEKKAAVAEYMKNYNIFKESGTSFMEKSAQVVDLAAKGPKVLPRETPREGEISPEELVKKLKKAVEEKLAAVKNQVLVDITEGGVRVQLVDAEGGMMFSLGSAEPTERAREIIKLVSENIRGSANRIAIEGHTDAAPFKNAQTTNWELSTARASAARRELEKNGIDSSKMARVVGYADQELLIPDNPTDARNRRISIILLHEKSSSKNP
jgi:chemotaxis protein MotB